jgi:hypothetical protein
LSDADEYHFAITAGFSSGLQQRLGDLFLVLALGKVANGNAFSLGPAMDGRDIRFADLPEGRRRGDLEPALAIEKPTDLPD